MRRNLRLFVAGLAIAFAFTGCTKKSEKPTIWIYTALYPYVMNDLNQRLEKKFPDVNFKWFQSGSENVAAKVEAEVLAGKIQADVIVTGDVFWYESLKNRGLLLAYDSPATKHVPIAYRDPGNTWACNRYAVLVMAYNSDVYSEADAPKSFKELTQPRFKDKVSMPSPLESGTGFTAIAMLSHRYGWDYIQKLRNNGINPTGGNSTVVSRMETKERPVGMLLLENVLTAREKNPKIVPVYPEDGVILMPGPAAISASTSNPELAKKVFDFFFSMDAAEVAYNGDFYSTLVEAPAPAGAKPLDAILKAGTQFPWDTKLIQGMKTERDEIKQKFSKIMFD